MAKPSNAEDMSLAKTLMELVTAMESNRPEPPSIRSFKGLGEYTAKDIDAANTQIEIACEVAMKLLIDLRAARKIIASIPGGVFPVKENYDAAIVLAETSYAK